jgi:hypothetical protein
MKVTEGAAMASRHQEEARRKEAKREEPAFSVFRMN